ncbi:unnamed protein product, partial [Polarella glacialis]
AQFSSKKGLAVHERHTSGGNHGKPSIASNATVTNACPWCLAVFASKAVARHHIARTLATNICSGGTSNNTFEIQDPSSMVCTFCPRECANIYELLACITTHVDGPTVQYM